MDNKASVGQIWTTDLKPGAQRYVMLALIEELAEYSRRSQTFRALVMVDTYMPHHEGTIQTYNAQFVDIWHRLV